MSQKVSVIVPIYNTAKYLPNCLDSILNQTYKNLEIILIDDGSTDNSKEITNNYAKKDDRIKVIHQKNSGQSAARNKGLKLATGDFISFVDSDDEIKPTFIEDLLAPFSKQNISLSVCGIHYKRLKQKSAENVYLNPLKPRKKSESKFAYILKLLALDGRLYSSVTKLYDAKIAKTCAFDESLNFAEDTKFVLDYLKKAPGEIAFVLKPLYAYNFGTETSTIKSTATNWQSWQTSYKNLKKWLGKNPSLQEKFWLGLVHLRWRISYLRSKRRTK
ncbi:MAG: glycosyltransferase family 2 protein [Candidatus Saccharibacteria bacterium]|nr:glycosyltransferase family 2 protein [Candidatus Saccharibacteria bacterium]